MRLIFVLALCLTICATAFGGYETVVISELQTAKTLAGVVTDMNGEALPDVIVREISPHGKTTIRSTTTDSEGRWSLPRAGRKTYHLLFLKSGFDNLQIRVRLSKLGKELRVSLPVAT
jgi:hypothetical protein